MKRLCMICNEQPRTSVFEFISAGSTIAVTHCAEHKQHAERKAEQWRLESPEPKTSLSHRETSKS